MSGHVISATQALAELPGLHARFANSPVGLCGLLPGQTGVLQDIILDGLTRLRLLDFGFTKGTRVQLVRKGPGGAVLAVRVRGALVALRHWDAEGILVSSDAVGS